MFTRFAVPVAFILALAARPAPAADAGFIGLQLGPSEFRKGLSVMGVLPDGPADKAGVKPGDVITELDGTAANDLKAFVDNVAGHKPGDEISLKVMRDAKEQVIKVKVGKRPAETPPPPPPDEGVGFIGLQLRPGPDGKGVEITAVVPDSPGEKAGLKKGDVIADMDGTAVTDIRVLAGAVGAKKPGDEVSLKLTRDGKEQTIKVKVGKRPAE
jgi:serine protease Do